MVSSAGDFFDLEWRDLASCLAEANGTFFPAGETGTAALATERAKRVCADCLVRLDCLDYAVATGQRFGIWGGTDENERRALRRRWVIARRASTKVDLVGWLGRAG